MKLKSGNAKLSKTIGVWNITAGVETCNRECPGCYAIKAQKRFPVVLSARQRNLEYSKSNNFNIILGRNHKYVRVHESGDFYSQEYIDKWVGIAKYNPNIIFYAYTKRMKDFDFSEMVKTENFVLHNSILLDGSYNFGKNISSKGGYVCPDTLGQDVKCGESCTWCMQKCNQGTQILFEQH